MLNPYVTNRRTLRPVPLNDLELRRAASWRFGRSLGGRSWEAREGTESLALAVGCEAVEDHGVSLCQSCLERG
ncbi:hypothetical protein L208DRAFT_586090 [Tricholoma matsutake]|nr:hypothetical protein L208DRAFT_586090 [Tricholoma matsutake 945]